MTSIQRRSIVVFLFAAAPVMALVIWLSVRGDLPDPIATHWKLNGDPDGFTSPTSFAVGMLCVSAALSLVGSFVVIFSVFRAGTGALAGVMGWTAWIFGGGLADALLSAHGAAQAKDVQSGWAHSVLVTGAGLIAGLLIWWLTPRPMSSIEPGSVTLPSYALASGEKAVWLGSATSRPLLRTGAAFIGAGTIELVTVSLFTIFDGLSAGTSTDSPMLISAAVAILVGLALAWCHSVAVRVDASGVTARLGGMPWPRFRFPIASLEAARAETVSPMQWGGWGFRLGGRRGSAIVIRKGPGIVLARKGRSDFAITVDDAESAAGLVNALIVSRTGS